LAWVVCWAWLLSSYSASINAQNLDPVTGLQLNSTSNVLNLGGGLPWNGTVTGAAGGTSGGPTPAYNPDTGNIIFSYASRTVSQTVAINQALANAGAGVQLSGYRYLWQIHNDLNNYEGNRGTLTGNVSLKGATGNIVESFNYNYNQNLPSFTSFSGIQFFNNRYDIASASSLTVSFTGRDQNNWAGYYGPRVHVDSFNLLYTVDPCKLNPAYSPTCSGFNTVVTTGNLAPYPDAVATSMTQMVAINTALKSAGFGATVHGFNYKFDYTVGQGFFGCTAWNQDGSCSWMMNTPAYVSASASMTNSGNQTLISRNHSFNSEGTSGTVNSQLLLSSSMNQTSLGNIRLSGGASGIGSSIGNYSMSLIYKPDPCVKNPLYSPDCSGFAQAMTAKLGANTTSTPTVESSVSSTSVATTNVIQPNSNSPSKPQTENASTTKGASQSKTVATALSIIAKNQQQTQALETSVAQAAVAEAASAASQAQQQAVSVATGLTAASQSLANSTAANNTTSNSNKSTANATSVSISSTAVPKNTAFTAATTTAPTESFTNSVTDSVTLRPASPVITSSVNTANTLPSTRNTTATTNTSVTTANTLPIIRNTTATATSDTVVTGIEMVVPRPTVPTVSANITTNTTTAPKNLTPSIVNITSANNTAEFSQSTSSISQTYSVKTQNQSPTPTIQTAVAATLPLLPPVNKPTAAQPVIIAPASTAVNQNNWTFSQSTADTQQTTMTTAYIQPQNTMFYAMAAAPVEQQQQATAQQVSFARQAEVEQVSSTAGFMTNRTDPLNEAVESKTAVTTANSTESAQTVKASVSDNELAGGVDIGRLATTPVGYSNYTNLVLKDGKMYEPKEIYKNQTTVDNARALRQLSTDRLHQQMIEQQYRR